METVRFQGKSVSIATLCITLSLSYSGICTGKWLGGGAPLIALLPMSAPPFSQDFLISAHTVCISTSASGLVCVKACFASDYLDNTNYVKHSGKID